MIEFKELLMPIVSMGGLGVAFGGLLAFASQKFEVKNDPRADGINAVLPAANCGGCGYPGCMNYAIAVAKGEAVNKCTVGGPAVAEKVAAIMGVDAVDAGERMVARVHCNGGIHAVDEFDYQGILSCRAMNLVSGGPKACKNGCLGCGDCMDVCRFGAIELVDGVAKIIPEKCTGCQACVKACPKQIIKMIPAIQNTVVDCMNNEIGAHVKRNCSVACIACRMCEKACRFDAIHVRHHDIENDAMHFILLKQLQCLQAVLRFQYAVALILQIDFNCITDFLFIIDNQYIIISHCFPFFPYFFTCFYHKP